MVYGLMVLLLNFIFLERVMYTSTSFVLTPGPASYLLTRYHPLVSIVSGMSSFIPVPRHFVQISHKSIIILISRIIFFRFLLLSATSSVQREKKSNLR